MKYLYFLIGFVLLFVVIIIYFQWIADVSEELVFFDGEIHSQVFLTYFFLISFFSGVFITLWVKEVLDNKDMGDEFDI